MSGTDTRSVIITGASAGIGQATAIRYAAAGYAVALAARRAERLEQVAQLCRQAGSPQVLVRPMDVADPEQVRRLVDDSAATFGRLDVMVNNAGFGLFERVHETSDEAMRRIFDVNFFGVFYGSREAARIMIRQGSGHIFNVSSVIGKRGTPFHGAYCATKFAIVGLCDSMRVELKPLGVRVTCVCPALTDTEFFQASQRSRSAGSSFHKFKSMTSADYVARRILRATGSSKPELVLTLGGKTLAMLSALSPRLVDWMMKLYHDDLQRNLGGLRR